MEHEVLVRIDSDNYARLVAAAEHHGATPEEQAALILECGLNLWLSALWDCTTTSDDGHP